MSRFRIRGASRLFAALAVVLAAPADAQTPEATGAQQAGRQQAETPGSVTPDTPDTPEPAGSAPTVPAVDSAAATDPADPADAATTTGTMRPADAAEPGRTDAASGIPVLRFVEPATWIEVELIDNVTGGCFLGADDAREHAIREIEKAGQQTTGPAERFHILFRIRAAGGRTRDGECFGAVFFEELYPIEVVVAPGAEPQQSNWHGRLGLQKLVITEDAFDQEVLGVIDDAVRILLRER